MPFDISKYRHIRVSPMGGVIGAEIDGVDVSKPLDDAVFAEIRQAFNEHHVIFFRDQQLDPVSLGTFAERFAPMTIPPYTKGIPGFPTITRLYRGAELPVTERNIGDRWHSDQSARELPNMAFALYCVKAPPYGGDTLFASQCEAYDRLSPAMKEMVSGLIGIHSMTGVFGTDGMGGGGTKKALVHKGAESHYKIDETLAAHLRAETEHPIVRTHPETGRPILYVTGDYLIRIKGMTDLESAPLIAQLNQQVSRPEFTCRFRWRPGSLAILDNRCTQHYALNDYAGFEREMLRTEMEGERPFGPAMPRQDGDLPLRDVADAA